MSKHYHFQGLNILTHKNSNELMFWLGDKESFPGYYQKGKPPRKAFTCSLHRTTALGLILSVGGEEEDITLQIECIFLSITLMIKYIVKSNDRRVEEIAKMTGRYRHEVDFNDIGVHTDIGFCFDRDTPFIHYAVWANDHYSTNRSIREKFQYFPYCEGLSKIIFLPTLRQIKEYVLTRLIKYLGRLKDG